jgi:hypothetical protein
VRRTWKPSKAIRRAVREADPPLRAEVARPVSDALGWYDALGRPKLMSCRVGLLRLHRAGLIELPAARNGNGLGLVKQPDAWPAEQPLTGSISQREAATKPARAGTAGLG